MAAGCHGVIAPGVVEGACASDVATSKSMRKALDINALEIRSRWNPAVPQFAMAWVQLIASGILGGNGMTAAPAAAWDSSVGSGTLRGRLPTMGIPVRPEVAWRFKPVRSVSAFVGQRSVNGPPGLPGLSVIEERCQ